MTAPVEYLPMDEPFGVLEPVASFNGAMPTGVTVSHRGRIFIRYPGWGDAVTFTVAEVRHGQPVVFPNEAINRTEPNDLAGTLVSVQTVVVDPADRLWLLDTGSRISSSASASMPRRFFCVRRRV